MLVLLYFSFMYGIEVMAFVDMHLFAAKRKVY